MNHHDESSPPFPGPSRKGTDCPADPGEIWRAHTVLGWRVGDVDPAHPDYIRVKIDCLDPLFSQGARRADPNTVDWPTVYASHDIGTPHNPGKVTK